MVTPCRWRHRTVIDTEKWHMMVVVHPVMTRRTMMTGRWWSRPVMTGAVMIARSVISRTVVARTVVARTVVTSGAMASVMIPSRAVITIISVTRARPPWTGVAMAVIAVGPVMRAGCTTSTGPRRRFIRFIRLIRFILRRPIGRRRSRPLRMTGAPTGLGICHRRCNHSKRHYKSRNTLQYPFHLVLLYLHLLILLRAKMPI